MARLISSRLLASSMLASALCVVAGAQAMALPQALPLPTAGAEALGDTSVAAAPNGLMPPPAPIPLAENDQAPDLLGDIVGFFERNFPVSAEGDTALTPAANDGVRAATASDPESTNQSVPVEAVSQAAAAPLAAPVDAPSPAAALPPLPLFEETPTEEAPPAAVAAAEAPTPTTTTETPAASREASKPEAPAEKMQTVAEIKPEVTTTLPLAESNVPLLPELPPPPPMSIVKSATEKPKSAAQPTTPTPIVEKRTVAPANELGNIVTKATTPVPVSTPMPPAIPTALGQYPQPKTAEPAATPSPALAAAPSSKLSEQTRAILSMLPSHVDAKPAKASSKDTLSVNRVSPEIDAILGAGAKEDKFESVGLSIKVRRPGLDVPHELARAYQALLGGHSAEAIDIYKDILSTDPTNEDALFGLAATYHRQGQLDKARPLYGMLLKQNPQHREGLNNFLVLVADESPQDALPELERLEQRNRDFSPIPAQIAVVLDKLGFVDQAREKMLRAIELAPNNLTYKYNLAVMLDRHGKAADASALYRLLIAAAERGEAVPATPAAMQKRVNYLTAAINQQVPGS